MNCVKCGSEITSGKNFCKNCGAPIAAPPMQVAVKENVTQAQQETARAASPPMNLTASPPTTGSLSPDIDRTFQGISAKNTVIVLIAAIGGVVAILVIGIVSYLFFFSSKRSILGKIEKGNLVKPEGSSAYDLFLKHRANDLSAPDVADIAALAQPRLEQRSEEIITRLKQEGVESEADWAEAVRLYDWLNYLQSNKRYESRKYFSQARLAFLKKEMNKAVTDYQRAIELEPTWALPLNGLGRVYIGFKDRANAREYYRRTTEVEPNWIYPWINLGNVSIEMNDYYTAENSLRQAIALDPKKASVRFSLGVTMEKSNRNCDAITEYRAALENAYNSSSPGFDIDALRKKIDRLSAKYTCN